MESDNGFGADKIHDKQISPEGCKFARPNQSAIIIALFVIPLIAALFLGFVNGTLNTKNISSPPTSTNK